MSNKRVLSASPDADTALDRQHMKKMPRKDILRGKLRDPVHNLNGDILNLIFDRLPIVDIVSCVFLSKTWKSAVLIWMHQSSKLAGQKLRRLCYETFPATLWQGLTIAEIKYHASSLYRINSAKATSLFSCHGPVGYLDVGDFVAHLSRGDPNFSDLDSVLRWRPLEPAYNPQDNELKVYEIPRMSERFLDSTVVAVFVNCDGVVLVNLEHLRVQERRLFVYSPVEEKRLWDYSYPIQDLRSRSLSWRVSFGPVALGRSYVYCVSAERPSSWVLLAYDFRTGKEVYRVRRGARCFHSQSTWLAEGKSVPDRLVRLVEVNGEELLVLISDSSKWAVGTVEIVKGRDGQLLHSMEYSPAWKASCLADPLTNQVALMWYKPAQKAVNLGHSITLMHTFSYQPGQPFALSPLIAVKRHTPCAQYETLQPFTMTNIEVTPTVMGGTPVQFTITRSCLTRVYSRWVYDLALQAALDLFDINPRHIPCYIADDPTAVTVSEPAGPSLPLSSQDSKTLSVNTMPIPAVYWLDHARLVIQAKAFTRVVRF